MSILESVSLVDIHVNAYRSAKLILKIPKPSYFLMSIQVFLVLTHLEVIRNNSMNAKKRGCDFEC